MKKYVSTLLAIVILLTITNVRSYAEEDTYRVIKEQGAIEEDFSTLSKKIDQLNSEFENLLESETEVERLLKNNAVSIQEKEEKKALSLDQIRILTNESQQLNQEYTKSVEQLNERLKVLKGRLVVIQDQNDPLNYLYILIDSANFNELLSRLTAMVIIIEADQELIEQTIEEQLNVIEKKNQLEEKQLELNQTKEELSIQLTELEEEKKQQTTLLNQIREKQQQIIQEKERVQDQSRFMQSSLKTTSMDYEKGVPTQYWPYYISAAEKYEVDWIILAAIHSIESNFSRHPTMISSAGAVGPMQFLKLTWIGYNYATSNGQPPSNIDITDLEVIKQGNGYGTDGDGDGKADPFSLADSIESAAKYLAKNGYAKNPAKAIYQYNHAQWYVEEVLTEAKRIKKLNE